MSTVFGPSSHRQVIKSSTQGKQHLLLGPTSGIRQAKACAASKPKAGTLCHLLFLTKYRTCFEYVTSKVAQTSHQSWRLSAVPQLNQNRTIRVRRSCAKHSQPHALSSTTKGPKTANTFLTPSVSRCHFWTSLPAQRAIEGSYRQATGREQAGCQQRACQQIAQCRAICDRRCHCCRHLRHS